MLIITLGAHGMFLSWASFILDVSRNRHGERIYLQGAIEAFLKE